MQSPRVSPKVPNEIFVSIIEAVWPEDLGAVVASSSRVLYLARDRLRHHEQLKIQYAQVTIIAGTGRPDDFLHPALLLRDICHEPFIAHYVKYIDYDCKNPFSSETLEFEGSQLDSSVRDAVEESGGFMDLIRKSPICWNDEGLGETLSDSIRVGEAGPTAMLLLALLPNLSRLRFAPSAWETSMAPLLDTSRKYGVNGQVLQRLKSVETYQSGADGGSSWEDVFPWSCLPMVETLRCKRVECLDGEEMVVPLTPAWTKFPVSLKCLHLIECDIHPEALKAILTPMRCLEEFVYTPSMQSILEIWDVGEMVSILIELLAESLRVLGFALPIGPIAAIKTLQPFKLDAVFPPMIESLTLWQAHDPASASQCVPRLFVANRDSLPCLRKLTYVGENMPCDTAQALREVNIEVVQKDWLRPQAYQYWIDNPPSSEE
ncbi:hypothetical protein LTR49_027412 [Elasticomyces elasticus]|nr:hypothetical protein LTR49_027412 [Elasticomyces elasticus]